MGLMGSGSDIGCNTFFLAKRGLFIWVVTSEIAELSLNEVSVNAIGLRRHPASVVNSRYRYVQ